MYIVLWWKRFPPPPPRPPTSVPQESFSGLFFPLLVLISTVLFRTVLSPVPAGSWSTLPGGPQQSSPGLGGAVRLGRGRDGESDSFINRLSIKALFQPHFQRYMVIPFLRLGGTTCNAIHSLSGPPTHTHTPSCLCFLFFRYARSLCLSTFQIPKFCHPSQSHGGSCPLKISHLSF